jgi:hypothetical protein
MGAKGSCVIITAVVVEEPYGPLPALYTADLLPEYFQDGEAPSQERRGTSRQHFMAIAHASRGTTTRVNDGVAAWARPGLKQQPCCAIVNFHFTSTAQSGFCSKWNGQGSGIHCFC